jgi:hypothetical protein
MVNLNGARHLHNGLVKEPLHVGILSSEPAKVDENANVSP